MIFTKDTIGFIKYGKLDSAATHQKKHWQEESGTCRWEITISSPVQWLGRGSSRQIQAVNGGNTCFRMTSYRSAHRELLKFVIYLIQVKQKCMSGKSQRDLVLREEIHIVLHGHTIQRWTSLRYIINIDLKGFVHDFNTDILTSKRRWVWNSFCFLCQAVPPITIPLNLNVSWIMQGSQGRIWVTALHVLAPWFFCCWYRSPHSDFILKANTL